MGDAGFRLYVKARDKEYQQILTVKTRSCYLGVFMELLMLSVPDSCTSHNWNSGKLLCKVSGISMRVWNVFCIQDWRCRIHDTLCQDLPGIYVFHFTDSSVLLLNKCSQDCGQQSEPLYEPLLYNTSTGDYHSSIEMLQRQIYINIDMLTILGMIYI